MNGTPKYASRAHRSAVAASAERYIIVNEANQIAANTVSAKKEPLTRETRRIITRNPNISISSVVAAVGTANGENR